MTVELLEQRAVPTVNPITLTNPGNQTNFDGDSVTLAVSATDTTGATLTYSGTDFPDGVSIAPSTGIITGPVSTTADAGGPYQTTVTASDGTYSASQTFTWMVNYPVAVTNPGDQTNYDSDQVNLTISATDASGGTLAYSASGLPAGVSILGNTGVISGTISSSADLNSPYTTTVTATDGTYSASQTLTWTVNNPVALTNPGDQTNYANDQISLAISASDANGTLTYSASGLPTGLSINASTGVISGTIGSTADTNSPYTTTVTASDGNSCSASQSFTWTVNPTVVAGITYDVATNQSLQADAGVGLLTDVYSSAIHNFTLTSITVNGATYSPGQTVSTATGAALTVAGDGSFTYVPATDYTGTDSFAFTITSGSHIERATVQLGVGAGVPPGQGQTVSFTTAGSFQYVSTEDFDNTSTVDEVPFAIDATTPLIEFVVFYVRLPSVSSTATVRLPISQETTTLRSQLKNFTFADSWGLVKQIVHVRGDLDRVINDLDNDVAQGLDTLPAEVARWFVDSDFQGSLGTVFYVLSTVRSKFASVAQGLDNDTNVYYDDPDCVGCTDGPCYGYWDWDPATGDVWVGICPPYHASDATDQDRYGMYWFSVNWKFAFGALAGDGFDASEIRL